MARPDYDSRSSVQRTSPRTATQPPGFTCSDFSAQEPIPYRVHSSAWPVRYALTDHGEDALRAMAGEL